MPRAANPVHGHQPGEVDLRRYQFDRIIMVAAPLAFPRHLLADAAKEHEGLLRRFRESIVFSEEDRATLSDAKCVDVVAGIVFDCSDGLVEALAPRSRVISLVKACRGVCRQLYALPDEEWTLPVVVNAMGALSLNLFHVRSRRGRPALTLGERNVVLEPADQTHFDVGSVTPWTATRWQGLGEQDEPRYAWVPTPLPPRDEVELVDRLVLAYEERIRRQVGVALQGVRSPSDLLVTLVATQCCGDGLGFRRRREHSSVTADYPSIARAIDTHADPARIPIVVVTERYGGLRWLRSDQGGRIELEPLGALVTRPMAVLDPNETLEFPDGPNSGRYLFARRTGIEGTIDRLVDLTQPEVDAEIILAGFEPARERAGGPGLREEVIEAIGARWGAREVDPGSTTSPHAIAAKAPPPSEEEAEPVGTEHVSHLHLESPDPARIRSLVTTLTSDRDDLCYARDLVPLMRDADLDVTDKLALFRELLCCSRRGTWNLESRGELAAMVTRGREPVAAAILQVVRAGGHPAMCALVDWLSDGRVREWGGTPSDAAEGLLGILAEDDAASVLDAFAPNLRADWGALMRIVRAHPQGGLALARRSLAVGDHGCATLALHGLLAVPAFHETCASSRWRSRPTQRPWGRATSRSWPCSISPRSTTPSGRCSRTARSSTCASSRSPSRGESARASRRGSMWPSVGCGSHQPPKTCSTSSVWRSAKPCAGGLQTRRQSASRIGSRATSRRSAASGRTVSAGPWRSRWRSAEGATPSTRGWVWSRSPSPWPNSLGAGRRSSTSSHRAT